MRVGWALLERWWIRDGWRLGFGADGMRAGAADGDVSNNLFIKYTHRLGKNNYICNVLKNLSLRQTTNT